MQEMDVIDNVMDEELNLMKNKDEGMLKSCNEKRSKFDGNNVRGCCKSNSRICRMEEEISVIIEDNQMVVGDGVEEQLNLMEVDEGITKEYNEKFIGYNIGNLVGCRKSNLKICRTEERTNRMEIDSMSFDKGKFLLAKLRSHLLFSLLVNYFPYDILY
ncbi:hypothetical protein Syun_009472 [Stephania yunnanensis]|uniref:Uncharacterized protein n=1 Tax=Stephania yunnanensis TaxID=152371 RepID=A0AAP0PNK4_9MAGN